LKKTNAVRILDELKIAYELREYEVDENDLSAENVAGKIGFPLESTFKTLVLSGNKTGILMACIPGNKELDLKMLALVSGNKSVEMVPLKEVLPLTGYIRGGVSPVGTRKKYPLYLDESAKLFDRISVSAGERGLQMLLNPVDLIRAAGAVLGTFGKDLR
jgi:Cys-tRNA(Pro)/Cys-tRNA(Cys) deacylase